jgi:hypothetical protein
MAFLHHISVMDTMRSERCSENRDSRMIDPNTAELHPSPGRPRSSRWHALRSRRTILSDVVQGTIIGGVLAFFTFQIIAHTYVTKVNGWTTMFGCGEPGSSTLLRGACAQVFPGPINMPQEAMYWITKVDSTGQTLSGQHDYLLHFPPGQLPPNRAFWSLTMGNARNQFVQNAINRYSVSDRSGLVPNADGSVDIYIRNAAPVAHESNWLPAPSSRFILWLRVYLPGSTILDGRYKAPPVVETQGSRP